MTGDVMWQRQTGFTYIAMLVAVAIVGIWLAATTSVMHLTVQREKEQELLHIGQQYRLALERYARTSVGGARRFPTRLEDLLLDERFPDKKRHMRRIYIDPMTGQAEWGTIRQADGQIIGVHSLSTHEPLKKSGFSVRDSSFVGKTTYSQWVFMASSSVDTSWTSPNIPPSQRPIGN